MSDVVDINTMRPHRSNAITCGFCDWKWVAVYPENTSVLQCPLCHQWVNEFGTHVSKHDTQGETLMNAADVLTAILHARDKGEDPLLILAEDSPLMDAAREALKPKAPYQSHALDEAVSKFLCWRLPRDFYPDAGVSFTPPPESSGEHWWPTGTNLFTAAQTRNMLEHVVGEHIAEQDATIAALESAQRWVPVSERLPDDDQVEAYEVVCHDTDTRRRFIDEIFWQMSYWEVPDSITVEYWREIQPLPAPPEGGR